MSAAPLEAAGDVLVLAGDIMTLDEPCDEFLDECERRFKHTFIVPGNHEYFGRVDVAHTLHDYRHDVRPTVHYLNNRTVRMGDVELFFTTLWTPIDPRCYAVAKADMPDFSHITYEGRPFEPQHYARVHAVCMAWLERALKESTAPVKVVVTHHCPVDGEDPAYGDNGLHSVFCVPMDDFIARCGASHWIFGHTHYNALSGMKVGGCTLWANQLGSSSRGPRPGFSRAATITL